VAPDRVANLHRLRRPPGYGGKGKDPVWWISVDDLGTNLQFRQDSSGHGLIEPAMTMSLNDFERELERTRVEQKTNLPVDPLYVDDLGGNSAHHGDRDEQVGPAAEVVRIRDAQVPVLLTQVPVRRIEVAGQ
jgi:hypothetical protein